MNAFPYLRLRRLRATRELRRLTAQSYPGPEHFLYPVFVVEGKSRLEEIKSLPGQYRVSVDCLEELLAPVLAQGIAGVLFFGVHEGKKDSTGSAAFSPDGIIPRAVAETARIFPAAVIATDVCLCAYTDHGHCGIINHKEKPDNDQSLPLIARLARLHAESGAHMVAPSAMLDGQVRAIRTELDKAGFSDTIIMSYSTKFASALYGPFRDAALSAPRCSDRSTYQADYQNSGLALRESQLDEMEGADILMLKPSLWYLDLLAGLRKSTNLPLAVYNVSGEYSMICAAAEKNWGDRYLLARESLCAFSRAGADIIISYWANQYNLIFNDKE
ncbi:MAG: hypothetical protein A2096_01315 [Spirochaetes bacterium GWF1_41_5]|nr:MAG: hypothetical protein A2096_01315 [Spirochaetes bacterium GWF1_41_5]